MTRHWYYGGSTAARTLACPAWKTLSADMPEQAASEVAQAGTAMHTLFERGINDPDYAPDNALGDVVDGVEITAEHVEKVWRALDLTVDMMEQNDIQQFQAEVQHETDDKTGGTADLVAVEDETLFVGDLKTGDGVIVAAEDNKQLLFYAWMMMDKYGFQGSEVVLFIVQPSERRTEPLDVWETDRQTVEAFASAFMQSVEKAESGGAEPCTGSHCRFCPAETNCPAKLGLVSESVRMAATGVALETLNRSMQLVNEVENWCKAVRKMAHEQAEAGVKIEGFKLVNKRAMRVWNDAEAVAKKLKSSRRWRMEDYNEIKLLSPAKIEKKAKEKKVKMDDYQTFISSVSSGHTLVAENDKRQAVVGGNATLARVRALAQQNKVEI